MEPGWLQREIAKARVEVLSWPPEKRENMRAWAARVPDPDPCRCKAACDEAQTCVGGCAYPQS